jgi:hypothetical protein
MSKVGPTTRKVTKEKDDKKGIEAAFKAADDAMKKGDINAYAALADFPITMITDDSAGNATVSPADHDAFVKMMGPAMNMPKDMKMSAKHNISLLSDNLAVVVDENTMTMGKVKATWKSEEVMVQKDGKWLFKTMTEAGWGDLMKAGAAEAAPAAPAAAPAAAKPAAAPAPAPAKK